MSAPDVADPNRAYLPVNLKREIIELVDRARHAYGQSRDAFVAQAVIDRLERLGVRLGTKK